MFTITVPKNSFRAYLVWLGLAHTNQAISEPVWIKDHLIDHARELHKINPECATVTET